MTTKPSITAEPSGKESYSNVTVDGKPLVPLHGGSRFVAFIDEKRVFKMDMPSRNLEQTTHEIKLLKRVEKEDRKYFPHLIDHGSLVVEEKTVYWLIETRLNVELGCTRIFEALDTYSKLEALEDKYSLTDISNNCHNYGWTSSGEVRILDAGFGKKMRGLEFEDEETEESFI